CTASHIQTCRRMYSWRTILWRLSSDEHVLPKEARRIIFTFFFFPDLIFILYLHTNLSPDGGIGRRAGLKHQFLWSAGSIPALGTKATAMVAFFGFSLLLLSFYNISNISNKIYLN